MAKETAMLVMASSPLLLSSWLLLLSLLINMIGMLILSWLDAHLQ